MSQAVIDEFESIEIQKQDRKGEVLPAFGPLHRLLEGVHKKNSIRQARQGIVKCVMYQFLFCLLAVGDVLHLEDQIGRAVLGIVDCRDAEQYPSELEVFMKVALLQLQAGDRALMQLLELLQHYA